MRLFAYLALAAAAAGPAYAQDSVTHASKALTGASDVTGHLAASGLESVAGAVALPVAVVGGASIVAGASAQAAGGAFTEGGAELAGAAHELLEATWGPLVVDDRIVMRPDPAPVLPHSPVGTAGR